MRAATASQLRGYATWSSTRRRTSAPSSMCSRIAAASPASSPGRAQVAAVERQLREPAGGAGHDGDAVADRDAADACLRGLGVRKHRQRAAREERRRPRPRAGSAARGALADRAAAAPTRPTPRRGARPRDGRPTRAASPVPARRAPCRARAGRRTRPPAAPAAAAAVAARRRRAQSSRSAGRGRSAHLAAQPLAVHDDHRRASVPCPGGRRGEQPALVQRRNRLPGMKTGSWTVSTVGRRAAAPAPGDRRRSGRGPRPRRSGRAGGGWRRAPSRARGSPIRPGRLDHGDARRRGPRRPPPGARARSPPNSSAWVRQSRTTSAPCRASAALWLPAYFRNQSQARTTRSRRPAIGRHRARTSRRSAESLARAAARRPAATRKPHVNPNAAIVFGSWR